MMTEDSEYPFSGPLISSPDCGIERIRLVYFFIIYGTGDDVVELGSASLICTGCQKNTTMPISKYYKYFHLFYFIPILTWSTMYFIKCPLCYHQQAIDYNAAKHLCGTIPLWRRLHPLIQTIILAIGAYFTLIAVFLVIMLGVSFFKEPSVRRGPEGNASTSSAPSSAGSSMPGAESIEPLPEWPSIESFQPVSLERIKALREVEFMQLPSSVARNFQTSLRLISQGNMDLAAASLILIDDDLKGTKGNHATKGLVLQFLGEVVVEKKQFARAREYFQRAAAMAHITGDSEMLIVCLLNAGLCHVELTESDPAIPLLKDAVALAERNGNRAYEALALQYMGHAHYIANHTSLAIRAYRKALKLDKNYQLEAERFDRSTVISRLALSYERFARESRAKREWKNAGRALQAAIELSKNSGDAIGLERQKEALKQIQSEMKDQ